MRRRDFISLFGSAVAAWPITARAQQTAMPLIGFLGSATPQTYEIRLRAFRQGLKETGYVEGQNVDIDYRWAEGQNSRLPALAAQLVQRRVTVIVAGGGTPTAVAAKAATTTIPIDFAVAVDPVAIGLVASLDRPGGNVTGVTNLNVEIGPKRLELLHELLPSVTTVAVLVNPANPVLAEPFVHGLQDAARRLGLQLHVLNASIERDIDTAFAELVRLRAGALVIGPDVFFNSHVEQLAALAIRWEQIDWNSATLHVRRVKSGKPSTHPVRGDELRALRKLQREAPKSPFVFVSERGGPFTTDSFNWMVKRAGQKADLPFQVHAHMLRHAAGYKLAGDGHDTRAIQDYLGHKNIQHTVRYTELSPTRFKDFWQD